MHLKTFRPVKAGCSLLPSLSAMLLVGRGRARDELAGDTNQAEGAKVLGGTISCLAEHCRETPPIWLGGACAGERNTWTATGLWDSR